METVLDGVVRTPELFRDPVLEMDDYVDRGVVDRRAIRDLSPLDALIGAWLAGLRLVHVHLSWKT
jgi:hypothetical protein